MFVLGRRASHAASRQTDLHLLEKSKVSGCVGVSRGEDVDKRAARGKADRWSHLYLERGILDRESNGLVLHSLDCHTPVPIDQISPLMLGPGISITHAAVHRLAENNCLVAWVGDNGVRLYAHGTGGTFSSRRLLHQARLATDEASRLMVAQRMYQKRFDEGTIQGKTLEQIRGMEGIRVRQSYREMAKRFGIRWEGRNYDQDDWFTANDVNRTLPPEFSRAERLDGVFFLAFPVGTEKKATWDIYGRGSQIPENQKQPTDENWTGAEIKACCRLAALLDLPLEESAQQVIPVAVTASEAIESSAPGRAVVAWHRMLSAFTSHRDRRHRAAGSMLILRRTEPIHPAILSGEIR